MCSHKNTSFYINHLNPSNYKNLFILLIYVSLHKKYQRSSCVFFTKTLHFKKSSCVLTKHLNPSNYKTCLYNLFVHLYRPVFFSQKIPKTVLCFFTKNTTFQKSSCVLTKHLNPSNYKTCLYNLFVHLYTKNTKDCTKDRPVFFHKNTTFQKSSCVLTKHLNPSNYKTCLYNLFVHLYTKNTKDRPVFFSQKHYISKILMCSHKTLKSE